VIGQSKGKREIQEKGDMGGKGTGWGRGREMRGREKKHRRGQEGRRR